MANKRAIFLASGLFLVSVVILTLLVRLPKGEEREVEEKIEYIEEEVITYLYGIPIDSFNLEESKIRQNQNLSEILLPRGISYARIDELAKKSKPIFDVRRMKAGKKCTFFFTRDSVRELKFLVYEKNLEEFVVFELDDSISVRNGQKDVEIETRFVSGIIESSLWNAMADLHVSTKLAVELSDIYAWTIDFFGIQKGDRFKIIYTVKVIDDEAIGVDEVIATSFYHGGKEHQAFKFQQNDHISYFDEDGQSLRRAFLKAPLNFRRISSKFSKSRFHPILKIYRPHSGVDYAAAAGTEVQTIGDGRVVKIAYDKASGNYIKIKHNSVYTSGYMHLQRRPKFNVGDYVKQGQAIGKVGQTGYATGPHLDFRVWKNGQTVDPLKIKSPPVEPVAEEFRARFDSVRTIYTQKLEEREREEIGSRK